MGLREAAWALAMLIAPGAALAQPATTAAPASRQTAAIEDYLQRQSAFGFTGAVVVVEEHRLLLSRGYGLADRHRRLAARTDTPFNVASLTKQFTAAAILRLEMDGRLSISDPIARYFPATPDDKAGITIHQLLTHMGGIARDGPPAAQRASRDETVRRILAAPLSGRPGGAFRYSNAGYQLLAAIIERVSGQPYGAYLQSALFRPAGMTQSGIVQDARWARAPIARGFSEWRDLPRFTEWPRGWNDGTGNGNVVSTARDLLRWITALDEGRVLSAAARDRLFANPVPADEDSSYGYGWYVARASDGSQVYSHGGDKTGYHSELRWNRAHGRIIVVLTGQEQYDESGVGLALHKRVIANAVTRLLDGQAPRAVPPGAVTLPAAAQRLLAGRYEMEGGRFTLWHDGMSLNVGADGQRALNLLTNADTAAAARYDRANARAAAIVRLIASGDRDALARLLPGNQHFFIDVWLGNWADFTRQHGPAAGFEVEGSYSFPWDPDLVRTVVRLRFARGAEDLDFTWTGETLYETLTATGAPHALIVRLAPQSPTEFASYDPVSGRSVRVAFREGPNARRVLAIAGASGEAVAVRVPAAGGPAQARR